MAYGKKHSFVWFDILCILIILLLIIGGIFTFLWVERENEQTDLLPVSLHYVVEITDIREEVADCVTVGDKVYYKDAKGMVYEFGEVSGIQTEICYYQSQDATEKTKVNGEMVDSPILSEKIGRVNILLTIRANGTIDEEGCHYIDQVKIMVGDKMTLMTQHFGGTGFCISLSEGEK